MSTPGLLIATAWLRNGFPAFHTLGSLASRAAEIFSTTWAQAGLARELVAQAPDGLYVPLCGPQLSLFLAPLAQLPYGWALTAWLAVNVLIYAFCCHAVWKVVRVFRRIARQF
jgi:hypothetical protein